MNVPETENTEQLRQRKMLAAVLIIGSVSELTALGIFYAVHLLHYLAPAVGIILGLHLLPLAGVYHRPLFRTCGWLLVAWSAACLLLPSHMVRMSVAGTAILSAILACILLFRPAPKHLIQE